MMEPGRSLTEKKNSRPPKNGWKFFDRGTASMGSIPTEHIKNVNFLGSKIEFFWKKYISRYIFVRSIHF